MDNEVYNNPTQHLIDYLASQGVMMPEDPFIPKGIELKSSEEKTTSENTETTNTDLNNKPVQTNNVNENSVKELAYHSKPYSVFERGFTLKEIEFWKQYGITREILKIYKVVSLDEFTSENKDSKPFTIQSSVEEPMFE